jgi:pimeloyl-ACP methyl ester carboxylesterase
MRTHKIESGEEIAYLAERRKGPSYASSGLFWLGGFKSSMDGTKAAALSKWAKSQGRECVRFDYSGHGASSGAFEDGTISKWLGEAVEVFDEITTGPQILIGSSMGGWLALLLLRQHVTKLAPADSRIRAMVLIAPAVDMTQALMWDGFPEAVRTEIMTRGVYARPSSYGDGPYVITRQLVEDGRRHLLLDSQLAVPCPVRIVQGLDDADVPWQHAVRVAQALDGDDITVTMIRNGDHRLSRDEDILRLLRMIERLAAKVDRRGG